MSIRNFISQGSTAFNSLVGISDTAYSFSEWLSSRAIAASEFLVNIAEVMELVDDTTDEVRSIDDIENAVYQYCASKDLNIQGSIVLPQGIAEVGDFLIALLNEQERYVKGASDDWRVKTFTAYDNDGNAVQVPLGETVDWLKTSSQSALIECSAFAAGLSENVNDRVTIFQSKVNNLLGHVSSKYNSYINYWNTLLSDIKVKSSEFISSFVTSVSLASSYEDYSAADEIAYKYTGSATRYIYSWNLNWSNFGQGVLSVLKIAFLLPAWVMQWTLGRLDELSASLRNKIRKGLIDPNDVGVLNDSDNAVPSIDSFCYTVEMSCELSQLQIAPLASITPSSENTYAMMLNYGPQVGDTFKFNLAIGEILLQITKVHLNQDWGQSVVFFTVNYKPYPINFEAYVSMVQCLHGNRVLGNQCLLYQYDNNDESNNYLMNYLNSLNSFINTQGSTIYTEEIDDSQFDYRFYCGLSMSISIFVDLMGILKEQMNLSSIATSVDHHVVSVNDDTGNSWISNIGYVTGDPAHTNPWNDFLLNIYDTYYGYVPSNPTNLQMIRMCSGYNASGGISYFDIPPFISQLFPNRAQYPSRSDSAILNGLLKASFLILLSLVYYNQVANELFKSRPGYVDYIESTGYFIPYLKNKESFLTSRYYILSDAQRNQIVSDNINKTIIITALAVTTVLATVAITKIVRRIRINRIAAQGQLDNKMWSGAKLTAAEARKYFRLARKNGNINDYTSDLLGLAIDEVKAGLPVDGSMAGYSELWRLISGTATVD